jgi:hypothetical protein
VKAVTLREDSDSYCLLWTGIALFSAYYFNVFYLALSLPGYIDAVRNYLGQMLLFPVILVVLLFSYMKSSRGRYRPPLLALALLVSLFYVLTASFLPEIAGVNTDWLFLSSWGIVSALLVAGGFSIMPSKRDIVSPGILDVASLRYGAPSDETPDETN